MATKNRVYYVKDSVHVFLNSVGKYLIFSYPYRSHSMPRCPFAFDEILTLKDHHVHRSIWSDSAGAELTNCANLEEIMKFGTVIELEKKEHFEILGHSVSSSGAILQQFEVFV